MQEFHGPLRKLIGQLDDPIKYFISFGEEKILLNDFIGKKISFEYLQEIFCVQCDRKTAKSFQQGYCYPCYKKLLDCNLCIIHPEKCNYPHNDCPDTWEHAHCKVEHIVYLANSSGLKIGITRSGQVPTRWIDQGASQAVPLFKVKNRNQSGMIEVLFKNYIADKTNWRKMLSKELEHYDMHAEKVSLLKKAEEELTLLFSRHAEIEPINEPGISLNYPVLDHPVNLKTISFDKQSEVAGELIGIKGQYLLLDTGVFNVRKHSGYKVRLSV